MIPHDKQWRQGARPPVGLCDTCCHVRVIRSDRGSVFYQCRRAQTDARFARYPALPVLRCPGFETHEGGGPGGTPVDG